MAVGVGGGNGVVDDPRGRAAHEAEARARLLKLGHNVSSWGPLRIERSILLMGTWRDLGTREEIHMVRYLAHLVPSLEADPWFQERVWSFYDTRRRERQVTNWWGCQNSGKTKTMAIMAIGFGILHPRRTRQLVSGPFKEAGDSEIWGQMCETYDEVRREWAKELERMGCGMKKMESRAVLRFSDEPRAGTLKLIAMDEVGKVQGGKARDRQQQSGYVLMWLDETGARYPTLAFLDALPNLKSNENFHAITACNPRYPEGELDGELGRPSGGYKSLRLDADFVWESAHGSRTYRFDGLKSPNFVCGRHWPWLFDQAREAKLRRDHGAGSDKYNEQCRAFMGTGSGSRYVLTHADVKNGMVDADFEWTAEPKTRVAYLDPALSSGGDDAVLTILEIGTRRELTGAVAPVIHAARQLVIPITSGLTVDSEWLAAYARVRGTSDGLPAIGHTISVERQLAIRTALILRDESIPFDHFGYDDSMRGKVMEASSGRWARHRSSSVTSASRTKFRCIR